MQNVRSADTRMCGTGGMSSNVGRFMRKECTEYNSELQGHTVVMGDQLGLTMVNFHSDRLRLPCAE